MDVNKLRKAELDYEIRVRGFEPKNTVAENRALLRSILSRERNGEFFAIPENIFDPNTELAECKTTLESLSEELEYCSDPVLEIRRLNVRFLHVRNRLERIVSGSSEQESMKKKLLEILLQLESLPGEMEKKSSAEDENISLLDMPNLLLPEIVCASPRAKKNANAIDHCPELVTSEEHDCEKSPHNEVSSPKMANVTVEDVKDRLRTVCLGDIQKAGKIDFGIPSTSENVLSSFKQPFSGYVPVYKWNIVFDGLSNVNDFLERLEEIRMSRGVSEDQLLRSAPELFSKSALIWYRSVRHSFHTWDALVEQLKRTFLPYDYEYDLREEINRRSQGSEEKIAIYVSVMEGLFSRLSQKPDEMERVRMIRRNLLPTYQRALAFHSITSISDLINLGSKWEEANNRASRFKPPPLNQSHLIGPDLTYQPHSDGRGRSSQTSRFYELQSHNCDEIVQSTQNQANLTSSNSGCRTVKCFNCDSYGHIYKQCPQPLRKRCFNCQTPNCTTKSCKKCNSNPGNFSVRN